MVIFKKSARKNGLVNTGDESKLACQIDREEDPGIRLLKELGAVLLPPGYKIANVEDVLTGRPSKEAYVFREMGSLYDQPGHVDSSVELNPNQTRDNGCYLHAGNLRLYQNQMPSVTLWLPQEDLKDKQISIAIVFGSSNIILAAYSFAQEHCKALFEEFSGSEDDTFKRYSRKVCEHFRTAQPDLPVERLEFRLLAVGPDDGVLIHGLGAHSGTGDAGYRLIATFDPEVDLACYFRANGPLYSLSVPSLQGWVRFPATTTCILSDSFFLRPLMHTHISQIPAAKPAKAARAPLRSKGE